MALTKNTRKHVKAGLRSTRLASDNLIGRYDAMCDSWQPRRLDHHVISGSSFALLLPISDPRQILCASGAYAKPILKYTSVSVCIKNYASYLSRDQKLSNELYCRVNPISCLPPPDMATYLPQPLLPTQTASYAVLPTPTSSVAHLSERKLVYLGIALTFLVACFAIGFKIYYVCSLNRVAFD